MANPDIPGSRHNPKILLADDAKIIGDGVAEALPVLGEYPAGGHCHVAIGLAVSDLQP
jgi:hypothetical protein